MYVITFSDVIYKGKSLCNCLIKRDMTLDQVLKIYCEVYEALAKSVELDEVKYTQLGIDKCKLTYENLITEIFNALINANVAISQNIGLINSSIQQIMQTVTSSKDEKVKASNTDPTAGFLSDKIVSKQPGSIIYDQGTISFIGFIPIGACIMINKSRLGDFDNAGRGKINTDVWGFAISDGQNGTVNRLGKFARYVNSGELTNQGNSAGVAGFTVAKENLQSMEIPVVGNIASSLGSTQFSTKFNRNKITDGSGGSVWLLRLGDGQSGSDEIKSLPIDLSHSHTFALKADLDNANPTSIPLVPEHILEIPIERIPV